MSEKMIQNVVFFSLAMTMTVAFLAMFCRILPG